MNERTWCLDFGHGGVINGIYQTAPKKMYKFPDGELAYEGVFNRVLGNIIMHIANAHNLHNVVICPTNLDLSLELRVDFANSLHKVYKNCVYLSLHANAGKGTGFEIWTSPGQTKSDEYADMFAEEIIADFPHEKFRRDTSDGDLDKESNFYVLKHTNCPAVLFENMFFDNREDWDKMKNPSFQGKLAECIVRVMRKINDLNN